MQKSQKLYNYALKIIALMTICCILITRDNLLSANKFGALLLITSIFAILL